MEVEIKGAIYRTGKLTPFQQFHVSRRLAPAMLALGKGAASLPAKEEGEPTSTEELLAFEPLVDAVSKMSNVDSEYILNCCLDTCTKKQGTGWQVIRVAGQWVFEDIDLEVMMRLVVETIKENLGNFMPGVSASSP